MISELIALHGPSGDTECVREYIIKHLSCPYRVDAKGNVIAFKAGKRHDKCLMAAAHMDEVGLIVKKVYPDGGLAFASVGGIDPRVMVSKTVSFKNGISGVIGFKAVHLQTAAERKADVREEELFIDIGADSHDEALSLVKIGDTAVFKGDYEPLGPHRFTGKAIDDRIGCECLLRLLESEKEYEYDFYGVFTDCEEIGGVGAAAAAEAIRPNAALVLEGTTCSDVPEVPEFDTVTHLGGGTVIAVRDRSMIGSAELRELLEKTAEAEKIPFQYKRTTAGGTDGGVIHVAAGGIRCAVLAVPVRYLHSAYSIADMRDAEAFFALAEKFCQRVGEIL